MSDMWHWENHHKFISEKKGEGTFSLFRNRPRQINEFSFLNDSQSSNLGGKSNIINSFNQPPTLGSNHSNSSICCGGCPSTSNDLSVPHKDFNLNIEFVSFKEDVPIKTSPSAKYFLCPTIHNTSTCDRDTPCSLPPSSDELSPQEKKRWGGCPWWNWKYPNPRELFPPVIIFSFAWRQLFKSYFSWYITNAFILERAIKTSSSIE